MRRRAIRSVPGAPDEHVYGFAFVPPDTLWLHRMGALEAYRWNGQRAGAIARRSAQDDGLPAVASGGLLHDRSGALWLTTRARLAALRPGRRAHAHVRRARRLAQPGIPDAAAADAAAGAGAGEHQRRPGAVRSGAHPRATVRAAAPDPGRGQPASRRGPRRAWRTDGSALRLGPDDRDLQVSARLLSFADPGAHRYRFRLHGYDADWVAVGALGEREFSRLEPGDYRMEVPASNADGVWSPARGFHLQVQPPWWRSRAALRGCGRLLALLLLARWRWLYRARLRFAHAEELREHRRRLSDQGSEAKTRFLATLGHEIRTPMTGVLGMAELLQVGELAPQGSARRSHRSSAPASTCCAWSTTRSTWRASKPASSTLDDAALRPARVARRGGGAAAAAGAARRAWAFRCNARRARRGRCAAMSAACARSCSTSAATRSSSPNAARSRCAAPPTPSGLMLEISDTGPGMDDGAGGAPVPALRAGRRPATPRAATAAAAWAWRSARSWRWR